jgi:DNA-binding XRE family transcriptional regulator
VLANAYSIGEKTLASKSIRYYCKRMLTPTHCRLGRAALGWTVRELAERTGVAASTVNRFELGKASPNASTLTVLRQAMEAAGVEFLDGDAPGIRLRRARA